MSFSLYNRFRDLEKVRVDKDASEGYLGASSSVGVLRTSSPLSYADGGDYVTLGFTASSVKLDDLGTPDNNTDLDFSTSLHGLVPRGTDTGTDFLRDDGTWATPAGAGADVKVAVDSGATADYLGALGTDGALRVTTNELTVADGGNFITLGLADHATARTALGLAIGTDVAAEGHNMSTHGDEDTYNISTSGTISTTNELDLTGAGAWIDLNPSGTGSKNIIDITPTGELVEGRTWDGMYVDVGLLDPASGDACTVHGFHFTALNFASVEHDAQVIGFLTRAAPADNSTGFRATLTELTEDVAQNAFRAFGGSVVLSATGKYRGLYVDYVDLTRNSGSPILEGVRIKLPDNYTDFGASFAGYFEGDGRSVTLCDTTYALTVVGATILDAGLTGVIRADSGVLSVDGDVTDIVSAASPTAAGKVELAIASEVNTGTSTALAVSPDSLEGSNYGKKAFCIIVHEHDDAVTVADGKVAFTVPAEMDTMSLVDVVASVYSQGITNTTDIQIRRRRAGSDADMLGTVVTIAAEFFASDGVVEADNDDISEGDQIYIDVDAIHSGTAPNGLSVTCIFAVTTVGE